MPVNSGSLGTQISFSDLQSAYGGSHPISLSEYYRGGDEVPSTMTTELLSANSDSGTSTKTKANITVTVNSTSVAGSISVQSGVSVPNSLSPPVTITVTSNTAWVYINFSSIGPTITWFRSDGSSGTGGSVAARGPAWQTGDQITTGFGSGTVPNPESLPQLPSGGHIGLTWSGGGVSFQRARRATRSFSTAYNHTIANNTGQTINLTASPWANNSSFASGTNLTSNGNSSPNWSWSHPAVTTTVNANTNIPTSGESSLNQFNVPGSFAG